jgi:hypothetical protein
MPERAKTVDDARSLTQGPTDPGSQQQRRRQLRFQSQKDQGFPDQIVHLGRQVCIYIIHFQ